MKLSKRDLTTDEKIRHKKKEDESSKKGGKSVKKNKNKLVDEKGSKKGSRREKLVKLKELKPMIEISLPESENDIDKKEKEKKETEKIKEREEKKKEKEKNKEKEKVKEKRKEKIIDKEKDKEEKQKITLIESIEKKKKKNKYYEISVPLKEVLVKEQLSKEPKILSNSTTLQSSSLTRSLQPAPLLKMSLPSVVNDEVENTQDFSDEEEDKDIQLITFRSNSPEFQQEKKS